MEVTLGKKGLCESWQAEFPEETECCRCGKQARIGFVAHEGMADDDQNGPWVYGLHDNEGKGGGYWPHDFCAVAVYWCKECLETTALYNQR